MRFGEYQVLLNTQVRFCRYYVGGGYLRWLFELWPFEIRRWIHKW